MGQERRRRVPDGFVPISPAYVGLATELVELLDSYSSQFVLRASSKPQLTALVAKTTIERQREALEGVLLLGEAGMGAICGAFIRQACEEQVWLNYLSRLEREAADDLVLAMGHSDNMRGLSAFLEFAGSEVLVGIGFTPGFAEQAAEQAAEAMTKLKNLRVTLGWPTGPVPPRIAWIAEQVDELDTIRYLFSATSRMIHFSAGEAIRYAGWFDPRDGVMHVAIPRVDHLYAFTLQNLIEMASKTLVHAFVIFARAGMDADPDIDPLLGLSKRALAAGRVPMVAAEEYHLKASQRSVNEDHR
jgi:hypothetical protein